MKVKLRKGGKERLQVRKKRMGAREEEIIVETVMPARQKVEREDKRALGKRGKQELKIGRIKEI